MKIADPGADLKAIALEYLESQDSIKEARDRLAAAQLRLSKALVELNTALGDEAVGQGVVILLEPRGALLVKGNTISRIEALS